VENLTREGIAGEKVHLVGDVMYDAALSFKGMAALRSNLPARLRLTHQSYALCTIHRAENTDIPERLVRIFGLLERLSQDIRVILPLHPRTLGLLARAGIDPYASNNPTVIEPIGYLDMMRLEASAALIVTDSGGVQKEAFFHRVPCVTLREETEWRELVDAGWNRLASPDDPEAALSAMHGAIGSTGRDLDLYGTGDAALRIIRALQTALSRY
jgi:UDP-GlcNAc3NAcA epimerase